MGAQTTGYTLTLDLQKGIFDDRFRSLPMARSAVLIGQTVSDLLMNLVALVVMAGMGLIVGWRVHTSPGEALAGLRLLLLFAYAFSWVTATVALPLRTPESFSGVANMVALPLVFVSNAFLDTSRLPAPVRVVAEWNPVSTFTQVARELFGNTSPATTASGAWPLQHAVPASLLWTAVILVVFVPLATRVYKKSVSNCPGRQLSSTSAAATCLVSSPLLETRQVEIPWRPALMAFTADGASNRTALAPLPRHPCAPMALTGAETSTSAKVELGGCARPYGTPCQHEHTCLRCPMININPKMLPRLDEIEADLLTRRARAEAEGRLGEIEGINLTLAFLRQKRDQTRRLAKVAPLDLGIPGIHSARPS